MSLELLKSKTGRALIESHRGIEGDVPENSWPAIQWEQNVQMNGMLRPVDIDVFSVGNPLDGKKILKS